MGRVKALAPSRSFGEEGRVVGGVASRKVESRTAVFWVEKDKDNENENENECGGAAGGEGNAEMESRG